MKRILVDEKAQFITFVAIALIVLGLLIGVAIDAGRAYLLRGKLFKLVDPMALAGAQAIGAADIDDDLQTLAKIAACDVGGLNGVDRTKCGPAGPEFFVNVVDVVSPNGSVQKTVMVSTTSILQTSFMRIGTFIGCKKPCQEIPVAAAASAVPVTVLDVVIVHDDTGSMRQDPDCNDDQSDDINGTGRCAIKLARDGATAFTNFLLDPPDGNLRDVQVALVPFRGCYNFTGASGCVDEDDEIIGLTKNSSVAIGDRGKPLINCSGVPASCPADNGSGIQGLWAQGNGARTNVCIGIAKGREILFGTNSRPFAKKAMVILTDAENTRRDPPGFPDCQGSSSSDVDQKTFNKASSIKASPDNVEIFVLGYGIGGANNPTDECIENAVKGNPRNLAKCIASSTPGTNDHYFEADDATEIPSLFQKIADELSRRLRLVG